MTDLLVHTLIYTSFAVLPGIIWLLYFLNKDRNPEPKKLILKVFLIGMIVTIPVFFIEAGLLLFIENLNLQNDLFNFIQYFLVVAITEEVFKYLAFRFTAQNTQYLDEPIDIAMYMIVAALGFATAENIVLFSQKTFEFLIEPASLSLIRFVGANLLHVLCSGIFGFYIAISFYQTKKRHLYFWSGLTIAVIIHGLFDFFLKYSIIEKGGENEWTPMFAIVIALLIVSCVLLNQGIKKLKRIKSVCKI
ncbi:MAG: PrsW family intramembrane metalloprotease [Candidatus ainarchaeum sp.]|nr:PrsW family intramembrane metalloprotease [Candidatus ainarchaeum sp.]